MAEEDEFDLTGVIKELEKKTGKPLQITVSYIDRAKLGNTELGVYIFEKTAGELDKRPFRIIPEHSLSLDRYFSKNEIKKLYDELETASKLTFASYYALQLKLIYISRTLESFLAWRNLVCDDGSREVYLNLARDTKTTDEENTTVAYIVPLFLREVSNNANSKN